MRISKNEPRTPVAKLRKALNLTQQELAARLAISFQAVQRYEAGARPSGEVRIKLANLAVSEGLADLAVELGDGSDFTPRTILERPAHIRLPASHEGHHLTDALHDAVDRVIASGDAGLIAELEELLQRTITDQHSPGARSNDMLHKRGSNHKWHDLLDKVLNSKYQRAIQENLHSFAEGIDAEQALAELQRRVDAGEFSGRLPSTPSAHDRGRGIEAAERKAAEAESVEAEALKAAEELRRTGKTHPPGSKRHQPPKTGSGGAHGGRS
ncbi:MAG TPA: helix-turn-helix transcriptional regulator [Bryobacteraceae bacterium]|nr:helix-turn-helix transcriptional regulator [Bryobacteraceae bacterium]